MDTTHDPIQRWGLEWNTSAGRDFVVPDHQGRYVTYDDHVEAVRQAEQRGRDDERKDAAERVAAIEHWDSFGSDGSRYVVYVSDPIAAALGEDGK